MALLTASSEKRWTKLENNMLDSTNDGQVTLDNGYPDRGLLEHWMGAG